jgi:hypothetical protein
MMTKLSSRGQTRKMNAMYQLKSRFANTHCYSWTPGTLNGSHNKARPEGKPRVAARLLLLVLSMGCLYSMPGWAAVAPPAIFYSDLESGPKTGGENGHGVYVTLWGKHFGAARGSSNVTTGAGAASIYPVWTDSKIVYQLGPNAATGSIVVSVGGQASNAIQFTVRNGNIYFVSKSGSDNNVGSFASPWSSITQAKNSLTAGDTAYIMDGVSQTSVEDYGASVSIQSGGTASSPVALVAYPNATATVGTAGTNYGLRTPAISGAKDYWVVSGLNLRGSTAMDLVGVTGWKVVGNDFSCPTGSGQSACFHSDTTNQLKFWGNYVHDVGNAAGSIDKYYHAVYFTTDSNHIDAGWNTIVPNPTHTTTSGGCRAMQFYSTGGSDQYDLHVHDNLIHDAICDGINFATVNPDKGVVEAYNNVVYRVGTGPDPSNGSSNYACVLAASSGAPAANVEIYNNTFSDCGRQGGSDAGAFTFYTRTRSRNNVVSQLGSEAYVARNSSAPSGSNNLWFGVGAGPAQTVANISSDPLFVNRGSDDLHLQSASPAKDAGTPIATLLSDKHGNKRPQGTRIDVGAYEFFSGTQTIACDLNNDAIVNSTDVAMAIDQALGTSPCAGAALTGDGTCTVVGVQRVINAVLGQTCRVGL